MVRIEASFMQGLARDALEISSHWQPSPCTCLVQPANGCRSSARRLPPRATSVSAARESATMESSSRYVRPSEFGSRSICTMPRAPCADT